MGTLSQEVFRTPGQLGKPDLISLATYTMTNHLLLSITSSIHTIRHEAGRLLTWSKLPIPVYPIRSQPSATLLPRADAWRARGASAAARLMRVALRAATCALAAL